MKRYYFYTVQFAPYIKKLLPITKSTKRRHEYTLSFTWKEDIHTLGNILLPILMFAAQIENPIYRYSSVMRKITDVLHKTAMHEAQLQALAQFLTDNRTLHIEGYVKFRMGAYHEALDFLSYKLIKKMKLYEQKDWS